MLGRLFEALDGRGIVALCLRDAAAGLPARASFSTSFAGMPEAFSSEKSAVRSIASIALRLSRCREISAVPHGRPRARSATSLDVRDVVAGIGQRQDRIRRAELGMREIGRRLDRLGHRDAARDLVRNEAAQLLGGSDDDRAVAGHLRRSHHEVNVMRIVAEPIHAHRRVGGAQIFLIDRRPPILLSAKASR